ncbi:SDR family oxidoreductase [Pseudolysinimonas kribbensis]|uniref:SDR family NAD(P)-dependent oxidoreductase n=1 Tax=Pseudolysinimonas kribbensis TaxID=433641 RepID=UPI0031D2715A
MDLQLTGKRALISGGGKGIGLAVARALVAEGVAVALSARGEGVTEVAAALAAETGGRVIGVRADTHDDASVRAAVAEVVAQLGGVDILVNTAAAPWKPGQRTSTIEVTDEQMREHFEVKALGYLRMARAAAPHMIDAGWGRIINVSGLGARHAGSAVQTVRNVAVSAITKNLADDLGQHGINVTVVHPGMTRTDAVADLVAERARAEGLSDDEMGARMAHNSIHRLVDASEVADVIAFLASPRSIAITGDAIAAGGGDPGVVAY